MRKLVLAYIMASTVALLSGSIPAYAQTTSPGSAKTDPKCASVKSQLGWQATICASWEEDTPNSGPSTIQGIISFTILSGSITNVSGASMYLLQCTSSGSCSTVQYTENPAKNTSGTGVALITAKQKMDSGGKDRSSINTPCLVWATKNQFACYNGVLESPWAVSN